MAYHTLIGTVLTSHRLAQCVQSLAPIAVRVRARARAKVRVRVRVRVRGGMSQPQSLG